MYFTSSGYAQSYKLYFASLRDGTIFRSNIDGTSQEQIGQGVSPRDFTSDPVNKKLYWVDQEGNTINRSDYDGGNFEVLLNNDDGIGGPTGIDIDVVAGKIYFAHGAIRQIARANLDGSNMETLIQTNLFGATEGPVGIAVDALNKFIYWTQRSGRIVQRANLTDGSNKQTILDFNDTDFDSSGDIEIEPSGRKLYLHAGPHIVSCNYDGSDLKTLYSNSTSAATGIAVKAAGNHLLWTEVDFFGTLDDRVNSGDLGGVGFDTVLTKFANNLENPYALEIVNIGTQSNTPDETTLTPDTKLAAPTLSLDGNKLNIRLDRFANVSLTSESAATRAKSKLTYRYNLRIKGPKKSNNKRILTKKDNLSVKLKAPGEYTVDYQAIIYSKLTKAQKRKSKFKKKKGIAAKFKKRKSTSYSPASTVTL